MGQRKGAFHWRRMRLILCQTASAGGRHPNDFFQKIPPPPHPPGKLSTVHPLSTRPASISGRALITEFVGKCPNVLCCNVRCGLFGHKSGLLRKMGIGCSCIVSNLTWKRKPPVVNLSIGTNHSWIFLPFVCKVHIFLSSLVNCQMQGFRIGIFLLELLICFLRSLTDCGVLVIQSTQMTHWLSCLLERRWWHSCPLPSLSLIFSGSLLCSKEESASWSLLLISSFFF